MTLEARKPIITPTMSTETMSCETAREAEIIRRTLSAPMQAARMMPHVSATPAVERSDGEERVSHRIDRYAHACTAIDPEDRGIGQGVAEERLHLQACDRDPCASDERGERLR